MKRFKLNRRNFIKGSAFITSSATGAGLMVGANPELEAATSKDQVSRTTALAQCPYCGVGCGVLLGVRGDKIVGVRGDKENPVNKGSLCVKGRYGYKFINHSDRLKTPLIRKDGKLVEATWEEAMDRIEEKFSQHKGDQFAALASARITNEDNYLIQKFTRAVMGTNNIDHCARL